ncbi:hypothetical protein [Niallia taxi]|uniref:hypothetical protein n=1 Tax=Niallia taxi TaxID=2499688 RepID=UPI0015F41A84|nr:hypothetical protein [Niallia taxi]
MVLKDFFFDFLNYAVFFVAVTVLIRICIYWSRKHVKNEVIIIRDTLVHLVIAALFGVVLALMYTFFKTEAVEITPTVMIGFMVLTFVPDFLFIEKAAEALIRNKTAMKDKNGPDDQSESDSNNNNGE